MSLKFLKVKAIVENQGGKATQISDFYECVCLLSCFSCVRLCESKDHSPPDSSVDGVLQAGILEWIATSSPGDLPDLQIKPASLTSPTLAGGCFITSATREALQPPSALNQTTGQKEAGRSQPCSATRPALESAGDACPQQPAQPKTIHS